MKEIEYDGFITREADLMKSEPKTLEYCNIRHYVSVNKASPIKECKYPRCEECIENVDGYCTVPMVVSKGIYLFARDELRRLNERVSELENLVIDEILGAHNDKVERADE